MGLFDKFKSTALETRRNAFEKAKEISSAITSIAKDISKKAVLLTGIGVVGATGAYAEGLKPLPTTSKTALQVCDDGSTVVTTTKITTTTQKITDTVKGETIVTVNKLAEVKSFNDQEDKNLERKTVEDFKIFDLTPQTTVKEVVNSVIRKSANWADGQKKLQQLVDHWTKKHPDWNLSKLQDPKLLDRLGTMNRTGKGGETILMITENQEIIQYTIKNTGVSQTASNAFEASESAKILMALTNTTTVQDVINEVLKGKTSWGDAMKKESKLMKDWKKVYGYDFTAWNLNKLAKLKDRKNITMMSLLKGAQVMPVAKAVPVTPKTMLTSLPQEEVIGFEDMNTTLNVYQARLVRQRAENKKPLEVAKTQSGIKAEACNEKTAVSVELAAGANSTDKDLGVLVVAAHKITDSTTISAAAAKTLDTTAAVVGVETQTNIGKVSGNLGVTKTNNQAVAPFESAFSKKNPGLQVNKAPEKIDVTTVSVGVGIETEDKLKASVRAHIAVDAKGGPVDTATEKYSVEKLSALEAQLSILDNSAKALIYSDGRYSGSLQTGIAGWGALGLDASKEQDYTNGKWDETTNSIEAWIQKDNIHLNTILGTANLNLKGYAGVQYDKPNAGVEVNLEKSNIDYSFRLGRQELGAQVILAANDYGTVVAGVNHNWEVGDTRGTVNWNIPLSKGNSEADRLARMKRSTSSNDKDLDNTEYCVADVAAKTSDLLKRQMNIAPGMVNVKKSVLPAIVIEEPVVTPPEIPQEIVVPASPEFAGIPAVTLGAFGQWVQVPLTLNNPPLDANGDPVVLTYSMSGGEKDSDGNIKPKIDAPSMAEVGFNGTTQSVRLSVPSANLAAGTYTQYIWATSNHVNGDPNKVTIMTPITIIKN